MYGDEDFIEVKFLRAFRDKYLQKNFLGRVFVWFYYKYSPKLAYVVNKVDFLKRISRKILDLIVYTIENKTSLKRHNFRKK